jgi:site-specific recombinase XerD
MNIDIGKLIDDFLQYVQINRGYSNLTIREYQHFLIFFKDWLDEQYPGISVENINLDVVNKYRLYLSKFHAKSGKLLQRITQGYYIIGLRSFLRYLLVQRDLNVMSPDKIELSKQAQRSVNFLNIDQVERLLNSPDLTNEIGIRDKTILETFFSTGMRVSELAKLNRDQIDLKRKEFGVRGKGNKVRVVFLSDIAAKWVFQYLQARDDNYKPLFIRYGGDRKIPGKNGENLRLSVRSIQKIVDKYAKISGLPVKVTPHILRHSFATDLLVSGADLRSVQEMLGHQSIRTTQVYTHVTDLHLRDIQKAFHSRSE